MISENFCWGKLNKNYKNEKKKRFNKEVFNKKRKKKEKK